MRSGSKLTMLAILLSTLVASVARAEGPVEDATASPGRLTEGTLLWRTAREAPLTPAPALSTDVQMRVTLIVLRATVRQTFANPATTWAEGVYVFPLPEDAAVDHLRMRIGDRIIEGVIQERAAAKAGYEQAKQEGRRASLVEQERPNVFTTSVANIPPGAAIEVEIEYQQTVRYDAGQFRLRFPMVVGPRYIPGASPAMVATGGSGWAEDTDAVPDASRITPPARDPSRGLVNPVSLTIELNPGTALAQLEAPYHEIQVTALADGSYHIELAQGSVPADRDFELMWQPAAAEAPEATLLAEQSGDEVFALLMVMPPLAEAGAAFGIPREVVFVIDVSGSMHGASIEQAKAALRLALARLGPRDAFNVISFNHRTDSLFASAQPATVPNRQAADRYVGALRAEGGTEMLAALHRALDGQEDPGRLRQVIFLTDGAVGNEDQLFTAIRERLGDRRLFTVGIGSAPNSHLMREAARVGRGTFTYIGSPTEVQAKMVALFQKLESPALTDLQLQIPGTTDADILPDVIPDLYLGEPVMVALRTRTLPARVVLRGRAGLDAWERELFLHEAYEGTGLSVHWARAKIAALLDMRRSGSPDDAVRLAVIDVALRHHLVSAYTSLVAVDVTPVRPGDEGLQSHALETNLPDGWSYTAVFGLGQGATAGPLHIALGLGALALATGLCAFSRVARRVRG
jgi:Ca-activated chloride channel family protein